MKNNVRRFARIYPWIIWTVAASFFFYKYLIQVSPGVMTSDLMRAFHVNGAGLGHLSAFYFYAYLLMQIPVGIMLDRMSPRRMTTLAIIVCSISTLFFSQTDSLWMACLSRALMGAGAAFAAVSCFKLASVWFAPNRFALVSGMFMTAAMLGAVGGQMPLSILVQQAGWREALETIGMSGLVLAILYFAIIRDKAPSPEHSPHHHDSIRTNLVLIFKNPQTWYLSLFSGLAFAPVSVFGGLWGVPFLEQAYHLSRSDAALSISMIFIGFALGAPFLGWLSDEMGRRKPILFAGTSLAFICLTAAIYIPNQHQLGLSILLFMFGFGTSGFFTSFAMIREVFPLMLSATILGFMNTFDSVCEALYEPLVGALLDWQWTGVLVDGIRHFTVGGYHKALSILPLSLLAAMLILCFIRETYCINYEMKS